MPTEPSGQKWRKSSRSGGEGGQCVELALANDRIRDSKNHQVLPLNQRAVTALLRAVKANRPQ